MNASLLLRVCLIVAINNCVSKSDLSMNDTEMNEEWKLFKLRFNISYKNSTVEEMRKEIFRNNSEMIKNHNKNYTDGTVTFGMEMNQFGVLTHDEFLNLFSYREKMGETSITDAADEVHFNYDSDIESTPPPKFCHWDKPEEVNIVKDQGSCRGGYAYSMADALAGRYFVFNNCTKPAPFLSAKYLIECSKGMGNHECKSGEPAKACRLVQINNGMPDEKSFNHQCNMNNYSSIVPFNITRCPVVSLTDDISAGNLRKTIWKHGPVSGAICVQHRNFQFAKGGVYSEENCDKIHNHDVLVVGYGIENGLNYWLVKNSFGTSWGDDGFLKISAKESKSGCRILRKCTYPEF